jgi:hypothetical protein
VLWFNDKFKFIFQMGKPIGYSLTSYDVSDLDRGPRAFMKDAPLYSGTRVTAG